MDKKRQKWSDAQMRGALQDADSNFKLSSCHEKELAIGKAFFYIFVGQFLS